MALKHEALPGFPVAELSEEETGEIIVVWGSDI